MFLLFFCFYVIITIYIWSRAQSICMNNRRKINFIMLFSCHTTFIFINTYFFIQHFFFCFFFLPTKNSATAAPLPPKTDRNNLTRTTQRCAESHTKNSKKKISNQNQYERKKKCPHCVRSVMGTPQGF